MAVLDERHGHRVLGAVEQAKIDASVGDAPATIDLDCAEPGLTSTLSPADKAVIACAHACVKRAGLRSNELDAIYLTGGSSALRPFQQALRKSFAGVPLVEGDLFGGVASGLAFAAR